MQSHEGTSLLSQDYERLMPRVKPDKNNISAELTEKYDPKAIRKKKMQIESFFGVHSWA